MVALMVFQSLLVLLFKTKKSSVLSSQSTKHFFFPSAFDAFLRKNKDQLFLWISTRSLRH
jgi:hypothetical protein